MSPREAAPTLAPDDGRRMYDLAAELYPICRSITGNGVRQTLAVLRRHIPLTVHEVPSGTKVFDWTVPREWNIRDAWVKDSSGRKVIDFQQHNLHVLHYSIPISQSVSLDELKRHLFSLPEKPDWIPHRTSYYQENWGFCLRDRDLLQLAAGDYEVCVDSTLADGALTYGELYLPGQTTDEVLLSCHVCHPSLANDNLSGIVLAVSLARRLAASPRRLSYRFLFIPGSIGSIVWLALNEEKTNSIRHGLVITCVGDSGPFHYKKSRRGDAVIDQAVSHVLRTSGRPHSILEFSPYGYDERQYCSPGFNLPVGSLMRTPNGRYPEYHTSADNMDLIAPGNLASSLEAYLEVIDVLEGNTVYRNLQPKCEPQLGRRGLYHSVGGSGALKDANMAMLWVLNLSDGAHSLLQIAQQSAMPFPIIWAAARALERAGLLEEIT